MAEPIEAVFQVEVVPSITQVGGNIPLVSGAKITAVDAFTNLELDSTAAQLDSSVPFDTTISGQRTVQQ